MHLRRLHSPYDAICQKPYPTQPFPLPEVLGYGYQPPHEPILLGLVLARIDVI